MAKQTPTSTPKSTSKSAPKWTTEHLADARRYIRHLKIDDIDVPLSKGTDVHLFEGKYFNESIACIEPCQKQATSGRFLSTPSTESAPSSHTYKECRAKKFKPEFLE